MKRKGKISRKTKETSISVDLNIDGKGKISKLTLELVFKSYVRTIIKTLIY